MRQRRGSLRRRSVAALALPALMAAVGCSDDAADEPIEATPPFSSTPSTDGARAVTSNSSDVASSTETVATAPARTTAATATATASPETIATVPDQRAPGLDSADGFCRGWSEFAGSFQALAFASAVGSDGVAAVRLEMVASGAVSAAAQLLGDEFPGPVASERDVFVDDVVGPFSRRAARATDELRAAGLSSDQIEQLGEAWLTALAEAEVDETTIEVTVPDELAGAVDAASAVFAADVPPIVSDPSLVTDAAAPATLGYLAENCPDQGILGGNDAID